MKSVHRKLENMCSSYYMILGHTRILAFYKVWPSFDPHVYVPIWIFQGDLVHAQINDEINS